MNYQSDVRVLRALRVTGVLLIAFSLTGCLKSNPTETPTTEESTTSSQTTEPVTTVSDLTNLAPASFDTDLMTHFTLGKAAARAWKPDAVLSYVSVTLATLAPNKGSEVYVFGSASDLDNWFTYSVSQDTGKSVRAIIPKADYLGSQLTPINEAYWSMNYVQALQLAEQNGGATFRISNPNPQMTVYLSNRTPRGWLWWTVEYTGASGETLVLLINPYLGGVADAQGNQLIPDRATPGTTSGTTSTSTQ